MNPLEIYQIQNRFTWCLKLFLERALFMFNRYIQCGYEAVYRQCTWLCDEIQRHLVLHTLEAWSLQYADSCKYIDRQPSKHNQKVMIEMVYWLFILYMMTRWNEWIIMRAKWMIDRNILKNKQFSFWNNFFLLESSWFNIVIIITSFFWLFVNKRASDRVNEW